MKIGDIINTGYGFAVALGEGSRKHCGDKQAAETFAAELMAKPKCLECGDPIYDCYMEGVKKQMNDRQLCFNCNFWTNLIAEKDKHLFIDGKSYQVGKDDPVGQRRWSGFGGSEFNIELLTGEKICTHNLWHQGTVPEHFRGRLPDTAKFIK